MKKMLSQQKCFAYEPYREVSISTRLSVLVMEHRQSIQFSKIHKQGNLGAHKRGMLFAHVQYGRQNSLPIKSCFYCLPPLAEAVNNRPMQLLLLLQLLKTTLLCCCILSLCAEIKTNKRNGRQYDLQTFFPCSFKILMQPTQS